MISDHDLCRAVADSYDVPPTVCVGDVRLVLTRLPDCLVVAIPGTRETSIADWARDLAAWPSVSKEHPLLGHCHDGCLRGAEAVRLAFLAAVGASPFIIAAHSLGAGIGVLLTAMLPVPPLRLVTFGAMRCSIGIAVPTILHDVPGAHYRNRGDPVPDLPDWPYGQWRDRTQLGEPRLPCISDHFIASYLPVVS